MAHTTHTSYKEMEQEYHLHLKSSTPTIKEEKKDKVILDKIVFCNSAHLGDIFLSKEFIRWMIEHIPAKEYIVTHNYDDKPLLDVGATFVKKLHDMNTGSWIITNKVLYVNCWLLSNNKKFYNFVDLGIVSLYNMLQYNL